MLHNAHILSFDFYLLFKLKILVIILVALAEVFQVFIIFVRSQR